MGKKLRRSVQKVARCITASLMVAGLMLLPEKTIAEEKKVGLELKLGAGYDHTIKEPRATAQINASLGLPLNTSLLFMWGVNVPVNGNTHPVRLEEFDAYLNTKITDNFSLFVGGYISKHLWVERFAPDIGLAVRLPEGFSIAGSYINLTGCEKPNLLLLVVGKEFLEGKMGIITKWGWTVGAFGSARIGVYLKPKDMPKLGIDGMLIVPTDNPMEVSFADTTLNATWNF